MKLLEDQQIELLKTPVASELLDKVRRNLLAVSGSDEDEAARRLVELYHDSEVSTILAADLERVEFSQTDQTPIFTIFAKAKLVTPPTSAIRKELRDYGVTTIVTNKTVIYMDFINMKHHVASLVMMYFLLYKFAGNNA